MSVFPGDQPNWVLVHCNSFGEPFAAYNAYNAKWAVPNGTPCTLWYGCSRSNDQEMTDLLNKMEAAGQPGQELHINQRWVGRSNLAEIPLHSLVS